MNIYDRYNQHWNILRSYFCNFEHAQKVTHKLRCGRRILQPSAHRKYRYQYWHIETGAHQVDYETRRSRCPPVDLTSLTSDLWVAWRWACGPCGDWGAPRQRAYSASSENIYCNIKQSWPWTDLDWCADCNIQTWWNAVTVQLVTANPILSFFTFLLAGKFA